MKKVLLLFLCLCALATGLGAAAEQAADPAGQAMTLFRGTRGGIAFALPGFGERLTDADNEGHWKNSIQLAGSCAADGAEYQLRSGDISEWIALYSASHPDASPRDAMGQTLYRYSFLVLGSYGAKATNVKAKAADDDTMLMTYDFTYPDTPGVTYHAKCLLRNGMACCLTIEPCAHSDAALDALRFADELDGNETPVRVDIAGLEAVFPHEPIRQHPQAEDTYIYAAFSADWSYLSVQYIPARISLPEDGDALWETMNRLAVEKIIPAFGGETVYTPRLFELDDGYMMNFSSISTVHMGEYGQRWLCRLYVTSGGIWYVYAADTEDGAAFMSRLLIQGETVRELTPGAADSGADAPKAAETGPLAFDAFSDRLTALLAERAFGVTYDGMYWSEPFFSDRHWVRIMYSTETSALPFLAVYTDGPEDTALVQEVRVLGPDPYCAYGDTAILASCAAEALTDAGTHEILRARLATRRRGEAPAEAYGAYTWKQTYFSSTDTAEKHHLITLTAAQPPETREVPAIPTEEPLPDIQGDTITAEALTERLNSLSQTFYGGQFPAQIITQTNDDTGESLWMILVGDSILIRPNTEDGTPSSPIRQAWIFTTEDNPPSVLAGTMLTFAAMAGLPEEEYMALNYRLMEYPLWGDLCGMLPLAAKDGMAAMLSEVDVGDGYVCMGWVDGVRDTAETAP